jgi:hypothetical protein
MTWIEAVKAMEDGKKIRKQEWEEDWFLCVNKNNMIEFSASFAAYTLQSHLEGPWEISQAYEDTRDNDWEIHQP